MSYRNKVLLDSAVRALEQARVLERRAKNLSEPVDGVPSAPWLLVEASVCKLLARELRRLCKHCEKRRLSYPLPSEQLPLKRKPEQLSLFV